MARRVFHLELEQGTQLGQSDTNKVRAIAAALRFAVDMNESFYSFAPQIAANGIVDYEKGDEKNDAVLAEVAEELLNDYYFGAYLEWLE